VNAGALVIWFYRQEYECQFSEPGIVSSPTNLPERNSGDEVLPLFSDPIDEGTGRHMTSYFVGYDNRAG